MPRPMVFPATGTTLRVPLAFAERSSISELNAPAMRLALVLLASASERSGAINIMKPALEAQAGVRLHSVDRLLMPVEDACIRSEPNDPATGERIFERFTYVRGERGKSAGIVLGQLTEEGYRFAVRSIHSVHVPADELREYASVPSLILRLRLGAALAMTKAKAIEERITADTIEDVFGTYARTAIIRRKPAGSDAAIKTYALSRAAAAMIEPAVAEINAVSKVVKVTMEHQKIGPRWTHIDVTAKRLSAPVTLTALAQHTARKRRAAGGG